MKNPPTEQRGLRFAAPLTPKWEGPYNVTMQVSRLIYGLIRLSMNERSERVYVADSTGYFFRDQEMGSVPLQQTLARVRERGLGAVASGFVRMLATIRAFAREGYAEFNDSAGL